MTHGGRRTSRLGIALVLLILLVLASCGSDSGRETGPQADPKAVAEEIQRAKVLAARRGKASFCSTRMLRIPPGGDEASATVVLDAPEARTGSRTFARIVNNSGAALAYGVAPEADELVQGRWRPRDFSSNESRVAFPGISLDLKAGAVSGCLEVPIPDDWHRGLYRITFEVEAEHGESKLRPGAFLRIV